MPTFGASLAGTFQVIEAAATGTVGILVFVAPGVTFHIVVHILSEPFATFDLDGAVHLTVARILHHTRHVTQRCTVFLFGAAVFHHLFATVLFTTFYAVHPRFLSLGICKLDSQVAYGIEFVAASQVDTSDIDDEGFTAKVARLVEVGNPCFHGFVTLGVEVFLFDLVGRNSHIARHREYEQAIFHLERYRLNFLVMGVLTETDVAFNFCGSIIAFSFGIVYGVPSFQGHRNSIGNRQAAKSHKKRFKREHLHYLSLLEKTNDEKVAFFSFIRDKVGLDFIILGYGYYPLYFADSLPRPKGAYCRNHPGARQGGRKHRGLAAAYGKRY